MNLIKKEMIEAIICGSKCIEEKRQCDFFRPWKNDCFWKSGYRCWNDEALDDLENQRPPRVTFDCHFNRISMEEKNGKSKKISEVPQLKEDVRGNLSDDVLQSQKG